MFKIILTFFYLNANLWVKLIVIFPQKVEDLSQVFQIMLTALKSMIYIERNLRQIVKEDTGHRVRGLTQVRQSTELECQHNISRDSGSDYSLPWVTPSELPIAKNLKEESVRGTNHHWWVTMKGKSRVWYLCIWSRVQVPFTGISNSRLFPDWPC